MTYRKRRALFYVSFFLFLGIAVPLILYPFGYRIHWDTLSLELTGGLFLSTQPKQASVAIEGKRERITSLLTGSVFVQNLKPGEYAVTVSKEEFWPWSKAITIEPHTVAEARVLLVPKTPKGGVLAKEEEALREWNILTNIKTDGEPTLKRSPRLPKNIRHTFRHPQEDTLFFILAGTNLSLWNQETETLSPILNTVAGLLVQGASLIILDTQSDTLFKTDLKGSNPQPVSPAALANITNADILESNGTYIVHTNDGMWALLPEEQGPKELARYKERPEIIKTERYILWWQGNDAWIYWTAPEQNLPFFQKERLEKILTTDQPITTVFPYPRRDYLVVAAGYGVWVAELDGRSTRNVVPFYKGKAPEVFVPKNERVIYILDDGALLKAELE